MLSARMVYARYSHIRQVTRERIHEQRCIHIQQRFIHIQQRFIQYIRLMTGSPFNSYKSYRVSVIESIDLNILIVNRNTVILDSMPKTICLKGRICRFA